MNEVKKMLDDLLVPLDSQLSRLCEQSQQLAEWMYQGQQEKAKEVYQLWLEGVQWTLEVVASFLQAQVSYINLAQYEQLSLKIYEKVCQVAFAWQDKDTTGVGDMLYHECLSLLYKLKEEVKTTLAYKGKVYDTH
jgi:hypothetical protein